MYGLWAFFYLSLLFPLSAVGHELWIEPTRYMLEPPEKIVANLRVGQYFKGSTLSFAPEKFVEFSVIDASGKRAVNGRLGDLPAVSEPSLRTGLHVLVHHSTVNTLRYSDFAKFERFARKEGNAWLLDAHKQRGLSRNEVTESFTRYAKALVLVGNGDGQDTWVGMPFEIVAETNPYTGPSDSAISVRLLWNGQGIADKQISIFRKHGGCEATRTTVLTDADGRASIPRQPGGRFLLNSVHVVEPSAASKKTRAMWQSFWASTTFELPVTDSQVPCAPAGEVNDR